MKRLNAVTTFGQHFRKTSQNNLPGTPARTAPSFSAFLLFLSFVASTVLCGCGSGGYPGTGIASVSASALTLDAGQSIQVSSAVTGQASVQWTLSGPSCTGAACGSLSSASSPQTTYTAPAAVSGPLQVSLQVALPGTSSSRTIAVTVNPLPAIASPPPAGTVGVAYSATLGVTGGTAPVVEKQIGGSLPPGLTFDSATGKVAGTPTAAGTYNVVLQATDASAVPASVNATEVFTIAPAAVPFTLVGGALPSGAVGTPYSVALQTMGGTAPETWSLLSGSLPAGLALSSAGVISGTPTGAGTANFSVQAEDATGAITSAVFTLSVNPTAPAKTTLALQTDLLPSGTVGVAYSSTIGVSGGTAPYTCTVTGNALPAGLTLGPNCLVSGTPTVAGSTNLGVTVTDGANPSDSGSGQVVLVINPAAVLTLTSPSPGTAGQPYTGKIGVAGGTGPYTCAVSAGSLPPGLTLSSDCSLSGTPTTATSTSVTVTARDSGNPAATTNGEVTVAIGPGAFGLTSGTVPNGTVGVPYSALVPLTGGNTPYTCTLAGGHLPSGLALGADCAVSGTPVTAGPASFTVKATDAENPAQTTTGPLTITINAQPTLSLASPPNATVGTPYTGSIGVTGGTAPYTCTVVNGTVPAGLALDTHCNLTGTPTTAGTATLTVQATDSSQPALQTSGPVTLQVNPAPTSLTVGSPVAATVDTPYTGSIPVAGGTAPYRCTLAAGAVPAGLTLGADCSLTGTPTTAGSATVSITATDAANPSRTFTGPATVTVNPVPALTFSGSLPNGVVNQPYLQTLTARGGVGPYTYALTAGTLPQGLTLASNGSISGTPTAPGASSFTVTATDAEGTPQTASLPLVLLVTYPATASDAAFSGPYAFLFQGYDDTVAGVVAFQTASIGSFTANGDGTVSSGEIDSNHQTSAAGAGNTVATHTALGTYTLGADGRGLLTLSTLNADSTLEGTHTYALALHAPIAPATVADRGSLIEYDSDQVQGTRGSGELHRQDATAFASGLTGSYVFGLQGDTPCTASCGLNLSLFGPVAEVGQFTVVQNALTGTADANIAAGNYPTNALGGTSATADSNGRMALGLTTANLPVGVHPVDYAVYLIDANQAYVMSTDKHSAYILLAGHAHRQQAAAFTNASLAGSYVGYENAPTNPGLVGQTLANVTNLSTAVLFQGNGDGAGSCTTNLVDQAGATALINNLTGLGGSLTGLQDALGSYTATGTSACTVAADGREVLNYVAPQTNVGGLITITGTAPAPRIAYLYAPNQGYFLESGYAGLGMLEQQTGSPFTVGTLNGTFVYGQTAAASVASTNASGFFTANGQGSAQTTLDENVGVGTVNVLQLGNSATQPYSLTSAPFGRYVLGTSVVIYAVSPTRFVLVDTNATTTSPTVALIQ